MSRFLFRLGRASARHPFRVIGVWVLAAVVAVALEGTLGGETVDDFTLPGTESQRAIHVLEQRFPQQAGASGQVVFHTTDGRLTDASRRRSVESTVAELRAVGGVVAASDPYDARSNALSSDGRTAFTTLQFASDAVSAQTAERIVAITQGPVADVTSGKTLGVQVEAGGTITEALDEIEGKEGIGLAVAVLVLLVAFGSVVAVGIPIGSALFGIFIGLAGVSLLAGGVDVPSVSPMLATMIGLGVGIDYALFVVTRHRQYLSDGWSVTEAAGRANATAGQAVLFAGTTVVIALVGLFISGIPAFGTMGLATGIVVTVSMIAAVTLLPAFLGMAGTWINRLRVGRRSSRRNSRGGAGVDASTDSVVARWAHHVGRRPARYAVVSLALLTALAAPLLALRVGFPDDGNAPTAHTERRAYDLLAAGFGPGFNAPLTVVIESEEGARVSAVAATAARRVAALDGIAGVGQPVVNGQGDAAVLLAYPTTSPQDEETKALVKKLRSTTLPAVVRGSGATALVTGWTAAGIDVSERLVSRTPLFIAAVVLLSFFLLMVLFRSVMVPLKAAIMNLLSIGASYGLLVAVFQWGWGKNLIGLHDTVPIFPYVPMIMFAILFGLSMDYEVFLLSRVREEYVRTGDSHASVVDGLASTGRVITSAALIMMSVFGAFTFSSDVELKMFGLGLAFAVLIDATVVRMVLVPATMSLLGSANWWLPSWLDRLLPQVDIEGRGSEESRELVPTGLAPVPSLSPVTEWGDEDEPELVPAA